MLLCITQDFLSADHYVVRWMLTPALPDAIFRRQTGPSLPKVGDVRVLQHACSPIEELDEFLGFVGFEWFIGKADGTGVPEERQFRPHTQQPLMVPGDRGLSRMGRGHIECQRATRYSRLIRVYNSASLPRIGT